jgi:hypothetical protein
MRPNFSFSEDYCSFHTLNTIWSNFTEFSKKLIGSITSKFFYSTRIFKQFVPLHVFSRGNAGSSSPQSKVGDLFWLKIWNQKVVFESSSSYDTCVQQTYPYSRCEPGHGGQNVCCRSIAGGFWLQGHWPLDTLFVSFPSCRRPGHAPARPRYHNAGSGHAPTDSIPCGTWADEGRKYLLFSYFIIFFFSYTYMQIGPNSCKYGHQQLYQHWLGRAIFSISWGLAHISTTSTPTRSFSIDQTQGFEEYPSNWQLDSGTLLLTSLTST